MAQEFTKVFEELKQQKHRQNLHRIWTMATSDKTDELKEEERKIAQIMIEHEEFHTQFDIADHLAEHDYDPNNEINPFIHIDIHLAVEGQLESGEPVETEIFVETMEAKGISRHEAIHCVGMILARLAYESVQKLKYFDLYWYKELLNNLKDLEPSEIEDALEKELTQYPLQ